ncbi:hypothetical protein QTP86_022914 [Hemibagrus guttatus]|nr:hypothetical protein QTP86_022914 [Hemibagrus guttatus]
MTSTAEPQSRMTSTAEQQDQATSTAEQQLRATSTAEHSHRAMSTNERRLRGDDVRLAEVWNSPRGGRAGARCCRNSPPLATDPGLFIDFRFCLFLLDYTLWITDITLLNSLPVPDFVIARPLSPARRMDPATSASGRAPSQNTPPITDPAELRDIIVQQGAIIRSYQDQVEALQDQLHSASIATPRDPPAARAGDVSRGTDPVCFCDVSIDKRALEWASAVWDADPHIRSSFLYFMGMIWEVFEYPAGGKDISLQLMELRQGSDAAVDYAIKFHTLAAQSGWNDALLWAVFRAGLNPKLQTELVCRVEATTLSQFVATAIRLDNLMRQHQAGTSRSATVRPWTWPDYPSSREEAPEPMQLGRSRLTEQVHRQRGQMRLCYNCRASGHLSPRCPEKSSSAQVGGSSLFFSLLVPVSLSLSDHCVSVPALIDSGAAVNLIEASLVEKLGIPTFPCMPSYVVQDYGH